jgi:hypothetical protein
MKIEVSIGEAIDKLSILELKDKKIIDTNKNIEIKKEIEALSGCTIYVKQFPLLYKLLIYVNESIWDMTDTIKSISITDSNFPLISNQIFEFNQKRFRIKNWFNLLTNSNIKEQKSYSPFNLNVIINNIEIFEEKLIDFYFLSLEYDNITIISNFNDIIKELIIIPVITYINPGQATINEFICLDTYYIDKNIKNILMSTN